MGYAVHCLALWCECLREHHERDAHANLCICTEIAYLMRTDNEYYGRPSAMLLNTHLSGKYNSICTVL